MKRIAAVIAVLLLLFVTSADAARRRRAVRSGPVAPTPEQPGTPAAWLAANAHRLTTVEPSTDRSDLAPLRTMIGSADVVGLGDATHGTHEFYAVKLRIIDFLVREMNFEVVAFEGAFPLFEKINVYVKGGPGDPRALLLEAQRLDYVFWDVEEILALIEWMRDYNLHRGSRPAVEIAGADIFDHASAAAKVVEYLQGVDASAANAAAQEYSCVKPGTLIDSACGTAAQRVLSALTPRRNDFVPITGPRAFDDAVQYATVVVQLYQGLGGVKRDAAMGRNALWIREHRGTSGKMILWGHQEHVARLTDGWIHGPTMGQNVHLALGARYFVIGTMGGSGSYGAWGAGQAFRAETLPTFAAESYEWYLDQGNGPYLLVPLRGALPDWLAAIRTYRTSDRGGITEAAQRDLSRMMDAVVYVDTTTPVRPVQH